ncbi:MAGE-domain-containing protein [Auricularia subglabra TFB-10046 SS5]|nr:MAGE-domain-containing protein [Auricularia subglabra TFB-10046 SS5]
MPPRASTRASQSQPTQKSYGRRGRAAQESDSEPEEQNGRDDDDDDDEEEERPRRGAKGSQATQSQRAAQSQRRRHDSSGDEAGDGDGGGDEHKSELLSRALVRMALAQEFKRTALRRDDINKKVLKGDSRGFKAVFDKTQSTLRKTFGFELVELVSRNERERILHGKEPELATQDGKKKAAQPTTTKQYVLRSSLEPELIAAASVIDRELAALEAAERAEDEQLGLARDETDPVPEGSILAQLDYDTMGPHSLGVLHVVLALIVVSGRTINEFQLRNMLKKMRITQNSHIRLPITATTPSISLENWFTTMIRQGYLDRLQTPAGGATATQGKRRMRARINADEESNDVYELRWGERAHAEISEKAVADWIVDFMLDAEAEPEDEDEDEELPARQRREREQEREKEREKKRKTKEIMLKDVRRAAGGLEDYHGLKE